MDSVRFGRALGVGVREAAKAAVKAAEAAAAPDPKASAGMKEPVREPVRVVDAVRQAAQASQGLKEGGRRFGQAALAPVAKAGGVLWHEVMGVLFGLFVLVAAEEAWRGRSQLMHGAGKTHEWFAVGMLGVFGWFMGSSFWKARRRGRR